jgi:dolichyl-diphosphooligosaccharide--protein glycosyltransferase
MVLSSFQPVYFASAAAMICGVQSLHDRSSFGGTRGGRAGSAIALALVGVAVFLVAVPSMRDALFYAGGWFSHGEELLGLVREMQPILAQADHFDLRFPIELFGAGFLVMPFVWFYLAFRAFTEGSAPRGLILFWSLAFIALTLQQWRFGNTLAPVFAVMIGAVLADWSTRLRQRIALRPLRPAVEILIVAVLVVWTAVAVAEYHRPILRASLDALASEQRRNLGPLVPHRRIYDEAGRWLARHTPPTRGYLDPALQPEYAVLASWDSGHLLRYRSERPMVQDNFGPYAGRQSFVSAWAYFASRDEEMAIEILDRLGVRYVIGGLTGAGSAHGLETEAMAFRLGLAFGSIMRLKDHGVVPGLSRHRLIFHAHSVRAGKGRRGLSPRRPAMSLGVWEVVPGAQIEGHAEPGAEIHLSLDLATSSTAYHVYRRETVADDRGVYRFIVPYPTDVRFSPDVRVARAYQLRSLSAEGELNIREEDVLAGGVIRGPDL